MASSVAVYHIDRHKRSTIVATAMAAGIRKVGDQVTMIPADRGRTGDGDVAVFYGFDKCLQGVFEAYRSAGKTVVYVDLGYFGRIEGGKHSGYHKISVNDRHPTAYLQNRVHDSARSQRFGIKIRDWTSGSSIIVAGASAKAAQVSGFEPQQWERSAIAILSRNTDRQIFYRPKPSWPGASPIPGSIFAKDQADISNALKDCHAVVTHHSNVGLDALIHGVPVFCIEGVASVLGLSDLSKIESPRKEGDREQLVRDVAYCQWSVSEMAEGLPWRHLKDEGLIP